MSVTSSFQLYNIIFFSLAPMFLFVTNRLSFGKCSSYFFLCSSFLLVHICFSLGGDIYIAWKVPTSENKYFSFRLFCTAKIMDDVVNADENCSFWQTITDDPVVVATDDNRR